MDSRYSEKGSQQQEVPTAPQDVPPSYAQSQQQPFVNQPLPYPHQNQQFPQQQQFSQQPPFHHQQLAQPYPQAAVQQINVLQLALDKYPINTTCPGCASNITTTVEMENNIPTHVLAGVLCFMCLCPCALIPYCCDATKSAIHSCPNCRAYIGTFNPFRGAVPRNNRRNW